MFRLRQSASANPSQFGEAFPSRLLAIVLWRLLRRPWLAARYAIVPRLPIACAPPQVAPVVGFRPVARLRSASLAGALLRSASHTQLRFVCRWLAVQQSAVPAREPLAARLLQRADARLREPEESLARLRSVSVIVVPRYEVLQSGRAPRQIDR